jgi:hypothetical protein
MRPPPSERARSYKAKTQPEKVLPRSRTKYKVRTIFESVNRVDETQKMIGNAKLAEDLAASLELKLPPVAVAFASVAPANIPSYEGIVPAGCVFWQEAATRMFVPRQRTMRSVRSARGRRSRQSAERETVARTSSFSIVDFA